MTMFLIGIVLVGIAIYVDVNANGFCREIDPGTFEDNKN